jgi:hypothetical protein
MQFYKKSLFFGYWGKRMNKELYGMNFKECCLDYVTCLNNPPNAWGQNYSVKAAGKLSHFWLGEIYETFGKEKSEKEIKRLLEKR